MTEPVTGDGLKILFLCEQYPPVVWDGAGIYTAVIAGVLTALGHEVHVLCAQGRRIVDEIHDGVRVHRRPLLRVPATRMLGRYGRVIAGRHHSRDSLSLRASLAASYAFWLRRLGLRPDVIETQDGDSRGLIRILGHTYPPVIHLHCPTMLPPRLSGEELSWKGRVADRVDRAVVAWADASGRPVVATARTGIAPYLERHGAGVVVPPDDPEALAAALRPLLVDPGLAVTVGARGRAAVADFEPRAVAMRRERVYRQAISRFETRRGTSPR
ncbi:glycosyltransferase [Parafrankia sp. EUN1f]|uniref:glycosyltransferase n=1 Tax=Parafrankia sp. EUN1f TaxID=102897 RepID=UPI0001C43E60|nr:glycosyltransferase [Parafrankia sp. EUN1f]EFC85098.1 hypothetical protein FrEUN1fDRAFT_1727 [Parafrankia sp. EUN1f]